MKLHDSAVCEPRRCRVRFWLGILMLFPIVLLAELAVAQDLLVYPAKGQSQTQQDKDRYECHTWAVKETGFDPSKPQAAASNYAGSQQYQPSQRHVLRGAGRGAALGAVGGAITGDAGKGAAAGAAMGGLVGAFRRRDERRQQAASAAGKCYLYYGFSADGLHTRYGCMPR